MMTIRTSRTLKRFTLACLFTMLVACSGLSDVPATLEPTAKGAFEMALDKQSVLLMGGGGARLNLTVRRDAGFKDEISLSLHGLPRGVISSFNSEADETNRITLATANRNLRTSRLVTVRARSGDIAREAQFRFFILPKPTFRFF